MTYAQDLTQVGKPLFDDVDHIAREVNRHPRGPIHHRTLEDLTELVQRVTHHIDPIAPTQIDRDTSSDSVLKSPT